MSLNLETEVMPHESRGDEDAVPLPESANWIANVRCLWERRHLLLRIAACAFLVSLVISLLIPKMYVSQARIMPPETNGSASMMYAALAQRALGSDALAGLAAGLMGSRGNGALFTAMLQSGSVTGRVMDRCNLLTIYGKRYRVDAAKVLARRTTIDQDKKSGVLSLSVRDTDPTRARDIAQAYLDALDQVVIRTSASPAHQERVFIEERLQQVKRDLARAEEAFSDFSSTHNAVDLKEQARATVESEAHVQGELVAAQGELDSLKQIYGDANVRVRSTQARIASLQRQLDKMGGSSGPLLPVPGSAGASSESTSYLPLRQVPRIAVPYATLYREVRVQETLLDLLTQQYEVARIQEAKDIPAVTLIDAPGIAEKKSFPPRALLTIALTLLTVLASCVVLLGRDAWVRIDPADPRRRLAHEMASSLGTRIRMRRPA